MDVTLGVRDSSGATVSQSYTLNVAEDQDAPQVELIATTNIGEIGDTVQFQARFSDNAQIRTVNILFDGQPLPLSPNFTTSVTLSAPGLFTARAEVTDASGNLGFAEREIRVLDPEDEEGPTVLLNAPEIQAQLQPAAQIPQNITDLLTVDVPGVVASPVNVIGTVQDQGLEFYRVELAPL